MKRKSPDTRLAAVARAVAAAEGKSDWRPFLRIARLVENALRPGKAETLVGLFPGYRPCGPQQAQRITSP